MTTEVADSHSPDLALVEGLLGDQDFWDAQRTAWLEAMTPMAREIFDAGAKAARNLRPKRTKARKALDWLLQRKDWLDPPEDIMNNVAGQVFDTYMNDWWAGLQETTQKGLRDALARAAADGTGTPGVIEDITPLFGEARAKLIGVTETTRLFGQGALATYRASDVTEWMWMTDEDDLVCPECELLDGQTFSVDEEFDPAHPGCRCFPSPVDNPDTAEADAGDGEPA